MARGTARAPRGRARDEDEDLDELEDLGGDEAQDVDADVFKVIDELGGDVEARVRLMRREGNTVAYLPSMPAAEFSVDRIAELWGGGKYIAKIYVGRTYKGGKTFTIAEDVKPNRSPTPNGAPTELGTVVTRLLDERGVTKQPATAVADTQASAFSMAKEIVALVATLNGGAGKAAPATSVDSDIERATKIINLGKALGGGAGAALEASEGKSDTVAMIEAVERMGTPLVQLAREKMQADRERLRLAPPAPATPAPAAPAAPASAAAPVTTKDETMEPWMAELAKWLPQAVKEAEDKQSASSFASYMMDRIEDDTFDHLKIFSARTDAVDLIIKYAPPLAPHREWVTEWLKTIQDAEDDTGDGLPPAGNIVHLN